MDDAADNGIGLCIRHFVFSLELAEYLLYNRVTVMILLSGSDVKSFKIPVFMRGASKFA